MDQDIHTLDFYVQTYALLKSDFVCSFTGESMDPDGTLAYAYYKEGASNPTFLFPKYALKATKV